MRIVTNAYTGHTNRIHPHSTTRVLSFYRRATLLHSSLVGFANSDAFLHTQSLASIQTTTSLPSSMNIGRATQARREHFSNQMRALFFNAMEILSTHLQGRNRLKLFANEMELGPNLQSVKVSSNMLHDVTLTF